MGIPDHLACLLRNLYAGQETTELDMGQQTASKLGKEYIKAVYCHPAYLTYMQRTSWEMPGWMKRKLESRLPGEKSIATDMQITQSSWQKVNKKWRASWWKWKRRVKKLTKTQCSKKWRSWHPVPSLQGKWWRNNGNTEKNFIFLAPKSLEMVTAAMKLKEACSLEEKLWPT